MRRLAWLAPIYVLSLGLSVSIAGCFDDGSCSGGAGGEGGAGGAAGSGGAGGEGGSGGSGGGGIPACASSPPTGTCEASSVCGYCAAKVSYSCACGGGSWTCVPSGACE